MSMMRCPSSRLLAFTPIAALALPRAATLALAAAAAASIAPAVLAQHEGDIGLTIEDDRLTTNLIDDDRFTPQRVFGAHLGEFGIPGVGDEPGFDSEPGTFAPGTFIGFTIAAPLKVWDGVGFVTTATDPLDGERMRLSFSTLSATTGDGVIEGFPLAVAPSGEWHVHFVFELLPAPGELGAEPGAYVLELTLHTTQEGVDGTQPFWIVFNHELDDEEFDSILEEAEAMLPGAGCLADLDDDGIVDGGDLAIILGSWGACPGCSADLNGDGQVDGVDLAILLGHWGPCR